MVQWFPYISRHQELYNLQRTILKKFLKQFEGSILHNKQLLLITVDPALHSDSINEGSILFINTIIKIAVYTETKYMLI
jgi:hypothetical protein